MLDGSFPLCYPPGHVSPGRRRFSRRHLASSHPRGNRFAVCKALRELGGRDNLAALKNKDAPPCPTSRLIPSGIHQRRKTGSRSNTGLVKVTSDQDENGVKPLFFGFFVVDCGYHGETIAVGIRRRCLSHHQSWQCAREHLSRRERSDAIPRDSG